MTQRHDGIAGTGGQFSHDRSRRRDRIARIGVDRAAPQAGELHRNGQDGTERGRLVGIKGLIADHIQRPGGHGDELIRGHTTLCQRPRDADDTSKARGDHHAIGVRLQHFAGGL